MEYNWPGNIRELVNVLERAAIVAQTFIDLNDIPLELEPKRDQAGLIKANQKRKKRIKTKPFPLTSLFLNSSRVKGMSRL